MITVAIIPKSLEDLIETLERVSFAPRIQIDVVDGEFVPHSSWPYQPAGDVNDVSVLLRQRRTEVDLMVKDQIIAAEHWQHAGARGIVFHLEALLDMSESLSTYKQDGNEVGLAIGNDTPLDRLYSHIEHIDFVQLMGIDKIGSQAQPFDPRVLERIVTLRALYPSLPICIDGGVNEETISTLKKAGADRFVVGSAILKAEDPESKYHELLKIIND